MDKELEEAQNLTRDDLVRQLETGRPAKLSRKHKAPRDPNQRAKRVMDLVTAKSERERQVLVLRPVPGSPRHISEITLQEEERSNTAERTVHPLHR